MSVIQFRRGTAAGNPVLAVGEPGYKTSTGEFKVGDGTTAWNSLPVFATTTNITAAVNAAVSGLVNGAPGALDTLKELADALGDDANFAATVTSALAAKAPLASPTFTGTVAGITKTMVGLGNVDNTPDAAKPVSTAQQTALDGKAQVLTPTAVKTSAYTAAAGDLVPVDATAGAVPQSLPAAPADKTRVAYKKVDATANVVTISAGGSDVFNKTGGSTSLTLSLPNQALSLQYKASGAIWYAVADDLPLGQLDVRFSAALAAMSIARDAAARITSVTENGITETYTRDSTGRLGTITRGGVTKTITRDSAGRILGVA